MMTLNVLNKNVKIDIEIEASEKQAIHNNVVLFTISKSPYSVNIKLDCDAMVCDLHYNLESYSIKKLGECLHYMPDGVTNILVCDNYGDNSILSILFVKDGESCEFNGKIINS